MSGIKTRAWALVALVALVVAAAAAAGANAVTGKGAAAPSKFVVAYQPGIGYAPIIMIKQQKLLEKKYPGTTFEWKVLPSASPITNGIIAGQIHTGAVGVGPLLVGYAAGINWKWLAPLSEADIWLMVKDPNIKQVSDLAGKKIALPTPTAIQAMVLRKIAKVKLGDAKALDASIVSLDHPDGMQALLTGQVGAHFTSPPFQFQEKEQGARVLARSYNYFGAHAFVGLVMQQKFYDEYTDFSNDVYKLVKQQADLAKKNPTLAAQLLSADAGGTPSPADFKKWMTNPAVSFTTRPRGLMRFANFMHSNGYLKKMPSSWTELVFPPVYPTKGS